ncbi:hypothetical protein [[Clostridium] fimetarium]|uniref:Uncharacterized protein n=1 Tax=[Clostridium] fimetarium TaxID=99656 RepID=A0A1I0NS15_9FIRM|nr:hypothetical protein [[Clostridium] fimetarium]SEW04285.1 hypothetical protein SAMN05421659_103328 [[Clostridium] fimetarium]
MNTTITAVITVLVFLGTIIYKIIRNVCINYEDSFMLTIEKKVFKRITDFIVLIFACSCFIFSEFIICKDIRFNNSVINILFIMYYILCYLFILFEVILGFTISIRLKSLTDKVSLVLNKMIAVLVVYGIIILPLWAICNSIYKIDMNWWIMIAITSVFLSIVSILPALLYSLFSIRVPLTFVFYDSDKECKMKIICAVDEKWIKCQIYEESSENDKKYYYSKDKLFEFPIQQELKGIVKK